MSVELWILIATAVLAAVAITAAVVALRAARRIAAAIPPHRLDSATEPAPLRPSSAIAIAYRQPPTRPNELMPRLVEDRLVVPPTEQQVVATAMGRPAVRLSILAHGVAHALRPESRDRITGLMRREYRRRRRERLQAGRRAVRAARPTPPSDQWLGS